MLPISPGGGSFRRFHRIPGVQKFRRALINAGRNSHVFRRRNAA